MAGWITAGDPGVDIGPYRAWRFADTYRDPAFAAGLGPRDVRRLLPPALSRTTPTWRAGRGGCRRSTAGCRRPARCSGRRPAGSGPTTTSRAGRGAASGRDQAAYGWTTAAVVRARRRRASGGSRASRASSTSARSARSRSRVRARSALLQRVAANDVDRPVGSRRLHAVVRRARRDGRRRHGHPARRRPLPRRDGRGLSGRRPGLAALRSASTPRRGGRDPRRQRGRWRRIGLWGPRARDILAAVSARRRRRRGAARCAGPRIDPGRPAPVARDADQLCRRAGLGADDGRAAGPSRVWDALRAAGRGARPRAVRLSGPRRAPDGEGLPLLRHGPDDARHAVRGRPRARSSASTRAEFIGRDALVGGARGRARTARRAGCGRCSSAATAYLPIYGGEAVRRDGARDRAAPQRGLRPTAGATIGYVYRSVRPIGEGRD